jgi:hypothetical protein
VLTRAPSLSRLEPKSTRKESPNLPPSYRISRSPTAKFKNSKFNSKSDLDTFTECFDKGLKGIFSEEGKPQFVKFGSARDNDNRCGVKGGKLTLQGQAISVCIRLHALKVLFHTI